MNNKILISVIIPTYNFLDTLIITLKSLEKSKFEKDKFEVLLIDDGSTDNTEIEVAKFLKKTKLQLYYFKQVHRGRGVRNFGLKKAKGNIIAFTDADCIVDKNWLSVIYETLSKDENTIISGYTYAEEFLMFPWKTSPVNQFGITANLAVKYSNLNNILFSEDFKILVAGDTDFVMRIKNMGYKMKCIPKMKILHPPHIYSLKQILKRVIHRQNEVLLYKKYGEEINTSFHFIFRPILFRISPITFIFAIFLIFIFLALKMNYILQLISLFILFIIFFIVFLYKYTVTNNYKNEYISIKNRIKTLIFLIAYIPFFILARIIGSVKFKFFMI